MPDQLTAKLSPGDGFLEACPELSLVGRGVDAYLWIGGASFCFATLGRTATRRFLTKAIGQVCPGAQVVMQKTRKRKRRKPT